MKRPLQLSLAIALALSGTDALALGLGTIHVNSKLNQPLDAEIPVLSGTQGEAEGLAVQLAAAEDFDRVGLNRSRLSVPLEFTVVKGNRGDLVIKVTSKEAIREPFLDFLVEANWPKGRLLREYTVLLDPPVMAPASGSAAVAAAPKAPAPTQPAPEPKPKATPAAPAAKAPPAVAAAPRPEPAPPKPAPASAPKHAAASGEYTVEAGDTLSGIARETKPDDATNINQMMLALLKQNPNAFFKDNINALKRGAILRIPTADQIKSVGSASEAAAAVHSQIEDWRGGAASKPTLVADTGTATETPKAPAKSTGSATTGTSGGAKANEHLALVPPKAGKDTAAGADRPGSGASGSASGSNNAELKAELARTKEALASREQEAGELKSRVRDLEDTRSKTDRLISLKDSEIADLQQKLKDLQEGKAGAKGAASTAPATTPPATTASSTSPATTSPSTTATATGAATTAGKAEAGKVSKEDIWGTASTSGESKPATPPAASTGTTPPGATTPPSTTASTTTPSATPSTTETNATGSTTPSSTASTTEPSTSASGTTPSPATTPEAPKPVASTTPPAKPAATTTPLKPTSTTKPAPIASQAWYEQSWVKPAAIGAGALLLLAGLLGLRKRKSAAASAGERGSIASAFGDSPIRESGGGATFAAEEQSLRDQIENDPANLGLHLELLSLLYSERNAPAFEDAAAAMHPYVVDAHQPEWLEARAMGQELAPYNPLFADATVAAADDEIFDDEAVTARHATPAFDHDDVFNFDSGPERKHEESAFDTPIPASTSAFDFDLGAPPPPSEPAQPAMPPPGESAFAFDSLPPLDFAAEAHHEIEPALEPAAPLPVDEDEFAGDDGVGTKLDLAKAYLDMGDPEGARSMLEEVLAEGNDSQKGEARKLMAEIR